MLLYKDTVLDKLAQTCNVAQFVSFEPNRKLTQRYSRIHGFSANHKFSSVKKAVTTLLSHAPDGTVNIRSFHPEQPKGEPLVYGLKEVDSITAILLKKASEKKYTIVNETIDIKDGGVSGVVLGGIIEFSPYDTPKSVDKEGVCALPRNIGLRILEKVYGFRPEIDFDSNVRAEFSIHPMRRGWRREHTIIWEIEYIDNVRLEVEVSWPNNFSRMLGDKTYGLLMANEIGLPVPKTTVIGRSIAPFTFGKSTGTAETWVRSCPEVRVPGKYPTTFGWSDPFELILSERELQSEGNGLVKIASFLSQEAVNAKWSGSLLTKKNGKALIEGVQGRGNEFMVGNAAPRRLPQEVISAVRKTFEVAYKRLGAVEIEWVYDGITAWVVQLHKNRAATSDSIIYPGKYTKYHYFEVRKGLDALRRLVKSLKNRSEGVVLLGNIGITSHFGDILRSAKIPSKIVRNLDKVNKLDPI